MTRLEVVFRLAEEAPPAATHAEIKRIAQRVFSYDETTAMEVALEVVAFRRAVSALSLAKL